MKSLQLLVGLFMSTVAIHAEEFALHTFERKQLTDVYYSEGAGAGDLNRDGIVDAVYGPYWFAGPDYRQKHEIYPVKAQNRERYADCFFSWVYDFNGDGWNDVLTAGFPGTPAFVYENPHSEGFAKHWPKHEVLNSVSNESPHFTNIVGDERPELVCTREGYFGYATIDPTKPFESWTFHNISDKIAPVPFGHGLGVGDVNGDGRLDLLMKDGWFEQPTTLDAGNWTLHKANFAGPGGAEIYAYDIDGDGDNDVITSLAAHEFGLAWHEQVKDGDKIAFRRHLIMGDRPEQNRYGTVFSELHSVNLADIDGDGLKDIVTGKTYWSHHRQSPMWDAGAVVYWFRLVRGPQGVDWVPHKADGEAGIGRQVTLQDVNGDGLTDIVLGGMVGGHVLIHNREVVSEQKWREAQPKPSEAPAKSQARGALPTFEQTGRVAGVLEGESLTVLSTTGGKSGVQPMSAFKAGRWSGNQQLFWSGAKPGDRLELELDTPQEGQYELAACFTMASDYGIVQIKLDDEALAEPLDLYNYPDVITTGMVNLGQRKLAAGKHRLSIEITGANASAVKAHMVGLDFVRLVRQ